MIDPTRAVNCELVELELFEARDGNLDESIRTHFANCSRCRELADWDRRFAESLRAEPVPSWSNVSTLVVQRMRSRRRYRAIAYATAASVLVASLLGIWRPWILQRQSVVEVRGTPPSRSDDMADLPMLFDPPPVDSLDLLTRQQDGYVVALRRLGDE